MAQLVDALASETSEKSHTSSSLVRSTNIFGGNMEEVLKEQIDYISEMINETSSEYIKDSLEKIMDVLTRLSESFHLDNNISIVQDRLKGIIEFIETITTKIEETDGPTDEETIDGLNILESNLKQCLNSKTI